MATTFIGQFEALMVVILQRKAIDPTRPYASEMCSATGSLLVAAVLTSELLY